MNQNISVKRLVGNSNLHLKIGDITDMKVDAIVNPANARLILGGGVAGAISRKGGPSIQEECNKIGGTFAGGAVMTHAGLLNCRKIIHAVGPMMGEGNEDEKLKNATLNSLRLASQDGLKSIAFPAISTGIFGYPIARCAKIMLKETFYFLNQNDSLSDVYFCLWDQNAYDVFLKELSAL